MRVDPLLTAKSEEPGGAEGAVAATEAGAEVVRPLKNLEKRPEEKKLKLK